MEHKIPIISFVIPVYNNANSIEVLYRQIQKIFVANHELLYEFVFINDSSKDNSEDILLRLRSRDKSVKLLSLTRNFGQVSAIQAGFDYAKGDAVIVISADMQDPVELSMTMIEKWKNGGKIVVACRKNRSDGIINKVLSNMFYGLIKLSSPNMPIGGFDYCLIDKEVLLFLKSLKYKNRFLQGDLLFSGYETVLIPYTRSLGISKPQKGIRNISFKTKYFIDGILHTTTYPIRIISFLGILTVLLGIIYSCAIVVEWFRGETPFKGWAPIMISILLIGGLILVTLGVLGEYIWRIYDEMKGLPNYIVKKDDVDEQ